MKAQSAAAAMGGGAGGGALNASKKLKVVAIGESGTGKSSLVVRLCKDEFVSTLHSTVGSSFFKYSVEVEADGNTPAQTINFDIWDTAGQERFKSLARMYYRGAAAIIVAYDITSVETFERAKQWIKELQATENAVLTLVGNKCDLADDRAVPTEEAAAFAQENDIEFAESSAKTGQGVREIFKKIAVRLAKATNVTTLAVGGIRAPGSTGVAAPKPQKKCEC